MSGCLSRIHDEKRHGGQLFFFRYLDVRIPSRIYVGILQWLISAGRTACHVCSAIYFDSFGYHTREACVHRFGVFHRTPLAMANV